MNRKLLLIFIISFPLLLSSCREAKAPTVADQPKTQTQPSPVAKDTAIDTTNNQPVNRAYDWSSKVKFKLENGAEAFSLKPKENGIKVEGADGAEIARLTTDDQGKIKIKDAADKTLGYLTSKDQAWKLTNAEQTEKLYILRQQADGDYKLESGDDQQIYRLKRRDYGWEIETPEKRSLYKVKAKAKKLMLRDQDDITVLKTNSDFPLLAIACFGFDVLSSEQQAAFAYAISLAGE